MRAKRSRLLFILVAPARTTSAVRAMEEHNALLQKKRCLLTIGGRLNNPDVPRACFAALTLSVPPPKPFP